jgi:hypothetical protein
MELPSKVLVYSQILGLNGTPGTLIDVRRDGCYELRLPSQGKLHAVLLPVSQTGLVFAESEAEVVPESDIER